LENIFNCVRVLAAEYPHFNFVLPLHPNPNLRDHAFNLLSNIENIRLIPALDYLSFIELLRYCHFVMTDSGGVQEEAPSFGKQIVLLRNNTERPEGLESGHVFMTGSNQGEIIRIGRVLLDSDEVHTGDDKYFNPYGDGLASKRIVEIISNLNLPDLQNPK